MRGTRIALTTGLAALMAAASLTAPAAAEKGGGNAAEGRAVFARCAACHAVTSGTKRLGPSLAGVIGRKAGSVSGFAYSPAMRGAKIVWSPSSLDSFLAKPAAKVPGNRMVFAGIADADDRADLIAYLGTLK